MILDAFRPTPVVTRAATCLAAIGAFLSASLPAGASVDPQRCQVPDSFVMQGAPLPHVALKLRSGRPLKIVAIGSSSTAGAGASSPQHSYPAQLAETLKRMWPHVAVEVVNRGVGGERSHQMLARFARDVLPEKPDLAIWQVGTNGALAGGSVGMMRELVLEGVDSLQKAGIDVVLMSPQFAPRFNEKPDHLLRVEAIRSAARDRYVGVFRRFEIMQAWIAGKRMTFDTMLSPDGLHLNDLSYGCIAHLLAVQIDRASRELPALAMPHVSVPTPASPAPVNLTAAPITAPAVAAPSLTASGVTTPGVASRPMPPITPMAPNTRF